MLWCFWLSFWLMFDVVVQVVVPCPCLHNVLYLGRYRARSHNAMKQVAVGNIHSAPEDQRRILPTQE